MKINEQPILVPNQQRQNAPMDHSNFEHWLNSPTKQNSGDEFYWQHQDQLQKSRLTFEKQNMSHPKTEAVITRAKQNDEISYLDLQSIDDQIPQSISDCKIEPIINNTTSSSLKRVISELIHDLSQLPIPKTNPISVFKSINNLKSEETKPIEYRFNKGKLNNYHLFIQNEEVELSLNTLELDKNE